MKTIMVNGDDFGLNERCSRAVAQAFDEGLITDTTMMANGVFFDEAVLLAREHGFFDRIGIHFDLTEGEPLTAPICRLPVFVTDGRFHKRYLQEPRVLTGEEKEAVFLELSAQVEKLRRSGIAVSHADSHHYVHLFTALAPIFVEVCRRYDIMKIRLNRTFATPERPRMTEDRVDDRYWREHGFVTTEHFGRLSDVAHTGVPDNTEIMVHPDYDKDGVLIDRTGTVNGCPVGAVLSEYRLIQR